MALVAKRTTFRRGLRLPVTASIAALVLIAAGCGAQPSPYLYTAAATAKCLRADPRSVPLLRLMVEAENRTAFSVGGPYKRLDPRLFPGWPNVPALIVNFGDPRLADTPEAAVLFLRGDIAARRLYEFLFQLFRRSSASRREPMFDPRRALQLQRNAVLEWDFTQAPRSDIRTILECLRTARQGV
jgi:hypothetical protein